MSADLEVVSHGGGWQSTALLVLAARGEIPFRTFLFANVGDHAENPATLTYHWEHAVPFAAEHGIELIELRRRHQRGPLKGQAIDLYDRLQDPKYQKSIPIPVYMANGAPGTRQCTARWKIEVIGQWLEAHGATSESPATVAVGFSADETYRIGRRTSEAWENVVYPLVDLGITRDQCPGIIASAGLPQPPKSSCWFCPFQSPESWRQRARERPEQFSAALALEDGLNQNRRALGRDDASLHRSGRPLALAVDTAQGVLDIDGAEGCDEGACWT